MSDTASPLRASSTRSHASSGHGKDTDDKPRHRSDRDRESHSHRDRGERESDRDRRRRRDSPADDEKPREKDRDAHRSSSSRHARDDDSHRDSKRRRSRSRSRDHDRSDRRDRGSYGGGGGGDYDRRPSYRDTREYDREYDRLGRPFCGLARDSVADPPPLRRPRHRGSPSYDPYGRDGDRGDRGPPRRERSPSPQLSEEQREMRSVFVSQLSARVTDRELSIFFDQQAGKVREARVIVDRISRRSKGVGYVEFVDLETVGKALALSNTKLLGIPIIVQYTEAEKNRQARDGQPGGGSQGNGLYVGSLNFALTESDIRQVFQPFGEVEVVDLHKDPVTGKSKGYAFVQFKDPKDAVQALEKMNNFSLAGREIKVGLVADKTAAFSRQEPQLDEGTGGNLNNISRIELMQKLSRSDRPVDLPKAPMFRPNIPQATTRNVMLKDAFNPEEETERDWDLELRDDVKGESEEKYGKVAEIFVVKESQGEIYIRFVTVESAILAVAGLNGRWFGGRQISAAHTTDSLFDAKKE
ncbi:RNA-binding protein 23/39, partial [Phenoliferia sp. Uapishka_3]